MGDAVRRVNPALRVAVATPVVALLLYLAFADQPTRPGIVFGLLGVGAALAGVTSWLLARPGGLPEAGQLAVGMVGVGVLPPFLHGLVAPAHAFGLLFALVIVVVGFTMADWWRLGLLAWILVTWFVALWWDGLREPDLLLLHVGGGALVATTVVRTANALGHAVASEARARADTEQRAELLARLLRVHTLERDEVLRTVVDGILDAGFDAASLRVLDGDDLVLAAGRVPSSVALPERIYREVGLAGRAVRSGRMEVVVGEDLAEVEVGSSTTGAVAAPLYADDRLEGVITALCFGPEITGSQLQTIELLASLGGRALLRARLYEADEATVSELRRLETHTQDFVSTVSHELRTPLTVVQGLGQMLRARWEDLAPVRRDDLLRRVDANANRLAQMVRSLLDTSAFEEGRIEIRPERIEVGPLIDGVLHRLTTVTASHPVAVDVADDLTVDADRGLLEHVLENLLTNTAKHTPQGTNVHLTARAHPDGVEITVGDDGPGIPEEDLPHVLDRFYRGGDPSSRPPGGLGLGLALVRQILDAHGSDLHVHSVVGEGTHFTFVVPCWVPQQQVDQAR
jgi:signal transduction histidine kinase